MFAARAKICAVRLWRAASRLLHLSPPDDPRSRPRAAPAPWPLRKPALVGHWRAAIGGGVEWCWHVADRSATVLPFGRAPPSGGGATKSDLGEHSPT